MYLMCEACHDLDAHRSAVEKPPTLTPAFIDSSRPTTSVDRDGDELYVCERCGTNWNWREERGWRPVTLPW
jgi:hypothetical protein